jgi:hypothetical protein
VQRAFTSTSGASGASGADAVGPPLGRGDAVDVGAGEAAELEDGAVEWADETLPGSFEPRSTLPSQPAAIATQGGTQARRRSEGNLEDIDPNLSTTWR